MYLVFSFHAFFVRSDCLKQFATGMDDRKWLQDAVALKGKIILGSCEY